MPDDRSESASPPTGGVKDDKSNAGAAASRKRDAAGTASLTPEPFPVPQPPGLPTPEPFRVPHPPSERSSSLADALELPPETTAAQAWEQKASLAEDRLAEVLAAFRKQRVETEEYRERATRQLEHRFTQQREQFLLKFLEILDNLDRALDAADHGFANDDLLQGLILVRTQLLQTLKEEGLERIPTLGLSYDPAVAEAMGTLPVNDPDHEGLVVKETQRGYRLSDRVVRHSVVFVGRYDPEAWAAADATRQAAERAAAELAAMPRPAGISSRPGPSATAPPGLPADGITPLADDEV